MRIEKWRACAAGVLVAGAAAQGDVVKFSVYENAADAPVQGLDLRMNLVSIGAAVDFVFRNESLMDSVVTAIYVESTAFSQGVLLNGEIVLPQELGVSFVPGAAPPNPAGSIASGDGTWGGNLFSVQAQAPGPHHGLSPGQSVTMRFELGDSYSALVGALSSSPAEFRIAQHVQGLDGGASVWTVSDGFLVIPGPGAAAIGLCGVGLVGIRRRRHKKMSA